MERIKSFNTAEFIIGHVGTGKTYLAERIVRVYARSCYVIVHDPTGSFEGEGIIQHADATSVREALADPKRAHGIHVLSRYDGQAVFRLAEEVAAASVARAGPDRLAVPTVLVLDEVVSVGGMSPSYIDPALAEAYMLRRHRHLGFVIGTQRPQFAHPSLYQYASRLRIFRSPAAVAPRLATLDIPPEILRQIPRLPDRYFVDFVPGRQAVVREPIR